MRTTIDIQRSELSKANNTFIVPFGFIGQACCNFFFFVRFVQSALILKQMTALASLEFVHSVSFFLVSFSFHIQWACFFVRMHYFSTLSTSYLRFDFGSIQAIATQQSTNDTAKTYMP